MSENNLIISFYLLRLLEDRIISPETFREVQRRLLKEFQKSARDKSNVA